MKKILVITSVLALFVAILFFKGYLTVTPQGKEAGAEAIATSKAQAKKAAAWTLETLFEKK